MSNPSESSAKATQDVIKYLEDNQVSDRLSEVVSRLSAEKPADPYAFLAAELAKLAKPPTVTKLVGREVLDSRGNPTVEVDVYARVLGEEKLVARQAAPSGASTGSNEANELRDGDAGRYLKKGCETAAKNVTTALSSAVAGLPVADFHALDAAILAKDGTRLKTNLGGNATTAASFAVADAGAHVAGKELFAFLEETWRAYHGPGTAAGAAGGATERKADTSAPAPKKFKLPRAMFNILNGGKHAGGDLKLQEFMVMPRGGIPFREQLRRATEVYHHLGKILAAKYGVAAKNLGDEGGYAPALSSPDEALHLIEDAIRAAGYRPGEDIELAMDAAASEFYHEGKYEVRPGEFLTSDEMVAFWVKLIGDHPAITSVEDPLWEKDYDGLIKLQAALTEQFGARCQLVLDDVTTTNTDYIQRGIADKWGSSLLLKVNQIGSLTEAMDAARMCFDANWSVVVSHRSGEVPYAIISDLAVAIGAGFIKTGAPARGERVAKYNRLLQIEEYLAEHGMLEL